MMGDPMSHDQGELYHASCVLLFGQGILIRGKSGSGKSQLALRLIMGEGACLVADDQVLLKPLNDRLIATAPDPIAGLLEVRGQGILRVQHEPRAVCRLVVDLLPVANIPRLPEQFELTTSIAGVELGRVMAATPEEAILHLNTRLRGGTAWLRTPPE